MDLEYQMKNFDETELVKYIELAEELYEIAKDTGCYEKIDFVDCSINIVILGK